MAHFPTATTTTTYALISVSWTTSSYAQVYAIGTSTLSTITETLILVGWTSIVVVPVRNPHNGEPETSPTATILFTPTSSAYTTVRATIETAYTPYIVPSSESSLIPRNVVLEELDDMKQVTSIYTPPIARKRDRRSYAAEYNRCDGLPTHDLATNSLMEVCRFIANVAFQSRVVSLRPTTAAYMPTWIGFVIQVVSAVVSIYSAPKAFQVLNVANLM